MSQVGERRGDRSVQGEDRDIKSKEGDLGDRSNDGERGDAREDLKEDKEEDDSDREGEEPVRDKKEELVEFDEYGSGERGGGLDNSSCDSNFCAPLK